MNKYTTIVSVLNQWLMFMNDDLLHDIDQNFLILEKNCSENPILEQKLKELTDLDIRFSCMIYHCIEKTWDDLGQIFDRTTRAISTDEWDEIEKYINSHIAHLCDRFVKMREAFLKTHGIKPQPYYLKSGLFFEKVENYRMRLKKRNEYRKKLAESLYTLGNRSIDKSNYAITFIALVVSLISLLISIKAIL